MKKTFVRILSLLFSIIALISFSSVSVFAAKAVDGTNWMSAIKDSAPITSLNIPGTHDSATQYVTASIIARTQSLSIAQQLQIGVRYFDIRLEKTDSGFIAVHGVADCKEDGSVFAKNLTAAKIIEYCRDFLRANPTETILFQVKEDDGNAGESFYQSFYDLYIKENTDVWYTENRIPSLGEVRGKIVLLRVVSASTNIFDDSNSGINFSAYPYIGNQEQYDYRRCDISKLDGNAYASMYVQDSYKLEGDKKWTAIKDFLDSDLESKDFNICMTNCTGKSTPQANAKDINARLMDYPFEKGRYYGIVTTDFITEDLSKLIFTTNSEVNLTAANDNPPTPTATVPHNNKPDNKPTKPNSGNVVEAPEESTDKVPDITNEDVPEAFTDDVTENAEDAEPEENTQPKKSNKWILPVCVAAGILLLGGGGGLAYYFIKLKK